ncbi:hypothetical protein LNQ81_01945 [Myroides sp. M-43]|uniref:hypothetical protein n=1 Tax=Myroides oncorhynchi TaxID=2893756 RepID=UPI001E2F7242|nr:hypothetical protein [Myroides oncorhynchi]MCC9041477.1 hypothetical protein [Myroides oncorhynchi]
MTNKDLVKSCFKALLENAIYDPSVIELYFSKKYMQCVDGVIFNFDQFTMHIQKLKELTHQLTLEFNHIIEEGDIVFTNHTVSIEKKDGSRSQIKVLATFIIKCNQIVYCDELTYQQNGKTDTSNLGSVV